FTRRAQEEIVGIARQALKDLAGTELDDCIAQVFIERVQNLDGNERERLAALAREAAAPAIVRSSTPLPPPTRQRLEAVLSETLGVKSALQFETSGALGTGIELWLNNYKIAWTLSDYLDAIQKSAAELIDKEAATTHGSTA
ncbi:MAG: hypothetical protein WBV90_06820, partial [Terrimicrobiaceae bacterium]